MNETAELNRRDFLRGSSFATLMTMLGGVELITRAPVEAADVETLVPFQVKCAVIGLGNWGREIIATLSRLKTAQLVTLCDTYPASVKRAANSAPAAKGVDDYRKILDDKEVRAVIIATPTHQHREIALAALQAGKHVYCEAPLAHTIADAKTIALAARAANKQVFQAGLQMRSDSQRRFLLDFIRAGAAGKAVKAHAQWHKKQSWRMASPNPDRERELNWRLSKETSLGLAGEIGIHQIDALSWFLNARPASVTGFASLMQWKDGRDMPDTVEAVFEYPGGAQLTFEGTLANSFDADYEMLYGTDAAIMMRGNKAWMFKEVDSPLLGWEVYARKDQFYKETGIALIANATKLTNLGEKATEEVSYTSKPLYFALESFLTNVNTISTAVEDFTANFATADKAALGQYLSEIKLQPAANYQEGFDATVMAIKAHESIITGNKVALPKDAFELT
ncbi:MAG TPA: Gfo/Idh/MocA family oxidoreductase [Haliangiales bacterium]|nr:Gfo/Idh/MocA family oxidoreductase [Haliangiales bacterium]